MTDFATLCQGGLTVPIYTSLTAQQVGYIIRDSDALVVVVSNPEQRAKVEAIRNDLNRVRYYITFEKKKFPVL